MLTDQEVEENLSRVEMGSTLVESWGSKDLSPLGLSYLLEAAVIL